MVPFEWLISRFIPSEHSSPNKPPRRSSTKIASASSDPIRTGILLFLTLFLALMAVASLVAGVFVAPKSDKTAMGLFAVFAGTLKGMLSVTKMLIR